MTEDFTISTAVSGNRAAITVMPKCANPKTERFGPESEMPVEPCMMPSTNATFLTSEGPYTFQFLVYDWSAAQIVEVNHAAPAPTNLPDPRIPVPVGTIRRLKTYPVGDWNPGWAPEEAWTDYEKMVIRFAAPLPVLPGLYTGLRGEQVVNYNVLELPGSVYMVTNRRVTEAELRVDDQIVRITSGEVPRLTLSQRQRQENQ